MKIFWVIFAIIGLVLVVYLLNANLHKSVQGSSTEIKYVPQSTPTVQSTPTQTLPKQTTPSTAQTTTPTKTLTPEERQNLLKTPTFSAPVIPKTTTPAVKPLTDCEKRGFWNCY